MGKPTKVIAVLIMMAALQLLDAEVALAQDTDGITVHCVNVTNADSRFFSCQDQHPTIQTGVNHAEPEEAVLVGAGTYPEQVTVLRPLLLEGAGFALTTVKPLVVSANSTSLASGFPIAAIVLVDGATGVAVTDLTVDGSAAAFNACAPGYVGIFYRESSGLIQDTHVTHIHHPLASGCQAVLGIFVQSGNGGPGLNSHVTILQNTVDDYGKNGITANEPGTFVTVSNNTVMGRGPTILGDAAQNGVQIGFGARGLVSGNTISDHYYVPPDFVACGLLFFQAGGGLGRTKNNTFFGNEQDICTAGVGPSPHSPFN
jgi:hypothetical protein